MLLKENECFTSALVFSFISGDATLSFCVTWWLQLAAFLYNFFDNATDHVQATWPWWLVATTWGEWAPSPTVRNILAVLTSSTSRTLWGTPSPLGEYFSFTCSPPLLATPHPSNKSGSILFWLQFCQQSSHPCPPQKSRLIRFWPSIGAECSCCCLTCEMLSWSNAEPPPVKCCRAQMQKNHHLWSTVVSKCRRTA